MPKITIDGTTYRIPAGWHEVTLDHYIFYKEHDENPVETVAYLCNIMPWVLQMNPAAIYRALRKKLDWFFTSLPSEKPTNVFWFEGVKYEYAGEYTSITLAQALDIESWSKEFGEAPTKALPYLIACLYTPATVQPSSWVARLKASLNPAQPTPYDSKAAEARGIAFHGLPLSVALPIVAFFLSRLERLQKLTKGWTNGQLMWASMLGNGLTSQGTGAGN